MDILDLLFPRKCLSCAKSGEYICKNCLLKAGKVRTICPECYYYSFAGNAHKSCQKKQGLDGLYSAWRYEGVIRKSILKLKYNFAYDLCEDLGNKFVNEFKNSRLKLNDPVLIPIPLHKKREKWRGFNQATELGKVIARNLDWEFNSEILIRKTNTKTQTRLKKKDREDNIKNAFTLNPKYKIQNTDYVIFDDVWTTGSTMKEACKVLKRNGAKIVWGMTVAR